MFVRAVARVHDGRVAHAREMLRRAGHRVTNDDTIGRHRFQIARGVEQRFAFGDTGGGNADVHGIGGKSFRRDFERSSRARGGFEEEIDDGAAAQRRHFLDLAFGDVAKSFSSVEQVRDLARIEFANAQQVSSIESSLHCSHKKSGHWPLPFQAVSDGRSTITTPSSSSNSWSMTLMISLFFVGTSLPM